MEAMSCTGPPAAWTYDRGNLDQLPGSEMGWARDADSDGQIVVDNREDISKMVAAHNAAIPTPTKSDGCGCVAVGGSPGAWLLTLAAGGLALARRRRRSVRF